jgi:hypothetical protein
MFKGMRRGEFAEWGTGILVVLIAGAVGQFAAQGMNAVQWMGAMVAVIGSIALAVLVRVWPAPAVQESQGD